MGKSRIHFLPLLIEHNIGKVVILIYYKIKWKILFLCSNPNGIQFSGSSFCIQHIFHYSFGIILLISFDKAINTFIAIGIEVFFQLVYRTSYLGEIKKQDLILSLIFCRMRTDPKVAKQLIKLIFTFDVIISPQHTDKQALAKTTRANKEQGIRLIL